MFKNFTQQNNLKSYRIDQLYQQYYKDAIKSWDNLTTWPINLREKLKKEIPFSKLNNFTEHVSKDKRTIKSLAFTKEGYPVETVLMKSKRRNTVCVSCMSGCPVGCTFCATGQMKFNRNLQTQEIIDQILYFKRKLKGTSQTISNQTITNIVFMGMGEPMLNLENVVEAIEILTDEKKMAMGSRRITVSSVGYIDPLEKFLKKDLGVKIAISLHSPSQELREEIMPTVAKSNTLNDLMSTLIDYQKRTNKKITYEYLLIKDVNDSPEHAKELAKLLKNQIVLVNLIRLNPSPQISFKPSNKKSVLSFQNILNSRGINNTLRQSYGNDINAACGQLANIT
jgi:23S rRNA (adenine2503-C2)-methyltransferase